MNHLDSALARSSDVSRLACVLLALLLALAFVPPALAADPAFLVRDINQVALAVS